MQNLKELQQIFSNGKEVFCDGCEFLGIDVEVLLYQNTESDYVNSMINCLEFEEIIYKYFEPSKFTTATDIYLENVTMNDQIHNDLIELIKFKVNQLS